MGPSFSSAMFAILETWQSRIGAGLLLLAVAILIVVLRGSTGIAAKGSLFPADEPSRKLERRGAVALIVLVLGSVLFFLWSFYDPNR